MSAKAIFKSLTETGLFTPEEVEAKVQQAIAEKFEGVDDRTAVALSEASFSKALAALDAVKLGELAINKSAVTAANEAFEKAAAADGEGPTLQDLYNIVKSHSAAIERRCQISDNLLVNHAKAIREVFVALAEGVNGVTENSAAELNIVKGHLVDLVKGSVKPQGFRSTAPVAGSTMQPPAGSKQEDPRQQAALMRNKVISIIKGETSKPETGLERRQALTYGFNSLAHCTDIGVIRKVANDLNIQLEG